MAIISKLKKNMFNSCSCSDIRMSSNSYKFSAILSAV